MVSKGSGNGSTSMAGSGGASSSRLSSLKSKAKGPDLSFQDVHPQLLQEMISYVVSEGALVSFSKTSDGGALVIYVKDGRDSEKYYSSNADKLEEDVTELHGVYKPS